MKKENILFWIAVLGFFGITGLDLLNAINETIKKLGNGIVVLLILWWLYYKLK